MAWFLNFFYLAHYYILDDEKSALLHFAAAVASEIAALICLEINLVFNSARSTTGQHDAAIDVDAN